MIKIWFDGVCEPTNPNGYGAYGLYIIKEGKEILKESIFVGKGEGISNNVAEYSGFLRALEFLKDKNWQKEKIIIKGDSKLVIEQMFGSWKMKQGLYLNFAYKAKNLLNQFSNISGQWIPREKNEICDKLAKDVLRNMKIRFKLQPE